MFTEPVSSELDLSAMRRAQRARDYAIRRGM